MVRAVRIPGRAGGPCVQAEPEEGLGKHPQKGGGEGPGWWSLDSGPVVILHKGLDASMVARGHVQDQGLMLSADRCGFSVRKNFLRVKTVQSRE